MGALSVIHSGVDFNAPQIKLIKDTVAKDTNNEEFNLFMEVAKRSGLDPFRKQIHAVVYGKKAKDQSKRKMSIITGIDGFRSIAARSGRYRPDENEAEYEYDPELKGPLNPLGLVKATVTINISDDAGSWHPVRGWAYWDEFAAIKDEMGENDQGRWAKTGNQTLDGQWPKMPRVMLAKCFDVETEILTSQGFQRFSAVTAPVMQVTAGGLEPVSAAPFRQPYAGPMVTLDSDDLNFCVTPNHDMVTTAGKVEAGAMYETARARPVHFIPRIAPARALDAEVSDAALQLAAAYLADGADTSATGFRIAVSRVRKVEALRAIGLHRSETVKNDAGRVAHTATRDITSAADKVSLSYKFEAAGGLVAAGKVVDLALLTALSQRQARLFADTLMAFDGSTQANGVRRFQASREGVMAAFELAAVIGGYAVSNRKSRVSDISTRPNYSVTISDRNAIGVRRWGRDYNGLSTDNARGRTGLEFTPNASGDVWCVTVPSGQIVVRRNGFSMVCGNCAEAQAIRKAFPEQTSGIYEAAELDRERVIELTATEVVGAFEEENRIARLGMTNSIILRLHPTGNLESIQIGKVYDRVVEASADWGLHQLDTFLQGNQPSLREFWARAKTDALELKAHLDSVRAKLVAAEKAEADAAEAEKADA